LKITEFDKNHVPNGILSKDMIKEVAYLTNALLDTEVKKTKTAQFFQAKSNATREIAIKSKFLEDGCDGLALDLV
jgi:hypothetical protein